jgi:hypothetical protein
MDRAIPPAPEGGAEGAGIGLSRDGSAGLKNAETAILTKCLDDAIVVSWEAPKEMGIIRTLPPLPPATSRVDLLLQFILAVAAEQDDFRCRELGPIHLLKYVYLADLAHAEHREGQTYTGVRWQFHHFGPWAFDVFQRIEPALQAIGAERKMVPSRHADDAVRYRLHPDEAEHVRQRAEQELPAAVQFCISRAIQEHGPDTASLLHAVYRTLPMLNAAPEEWLDFSVVRESRAEYAVTSPDEQLSRTQRKKREQLLSDIRAEVQARLAEKLSAGGTPVRPPRYDEVFAKGLEWLDQLAGEAVTERQGKLEVGDDVWKSETRRGPEVP